MNQRDRVRDRLRGKLPEIVLEAASVAFAVLLAFWVDEWRQERQERELAARARTAIVAELSANRDELRASLAAHQRTLDSLPELIRRVAGDSVARLNVGLLVPELSSAAWRTAQATEAATLMDYTWLLRVSRAYDIQELYLRGQEDLLRIVAEQQEPTTWLRSIERRLAMSIQVGVQLDSSYGTVLRAASSP